MWNYKNALLIISGISLCLISYLIYKIYTLDPIDAGFLVNEQAINLTS